MDSRETDLIFHTPPGRPLEIKLESGAISGAAWRPAGQPGDATLYQRDARLIGTSVGGVAQQIFLFQSSRPGPHILLFDLKLPHQPMARRRRRVIVHVVAAGEPLEMT